MIQDVGELDRESGPNTFRELGVLGKRGVHIPAVQASEIANGAATRLHPLGLTVESYLVMLLLAELSGLDCL